MSMWGGSPTGSFFSHLVAPDGSLGDMARPNEIGFKQGDGDQNVHDWYYEAAAAGVVMQAEILLVSRDLEAIRYFLPKMERACDFIEKTRDPKNGLFLVGPASNLLAPSYGGVKQPDGTFGKGYLAGLSITYLAALDRMAELYKMTGDKAKLDEYGRRQKITRESLPLLLTSDGYFAKSMEPGGVKHGVLGQERFGYLEGVANADAAGLRVVDDKTAESIYKQIAGFPAIRPLDFLLTNAPGLDDTYWNWGHTTGEGFSGFHKFGDWVNGGVWGTVEGRAILMYYRLGKFEDIRRSAGRAMTVKSSDEVVLLYNDLPENAKIEMTTEGGWPGESPATAYPAFPALIPEQGPQAQAPAELPESLKKPFAALTAMKRRLAGERDAEDEIAFIDAAIKSCQDYRVRVTMNPGPGYYRAITPERRKGINKFYEQAALSMYQGFVKRMERYAVKGNTRQRRIASLFSEAQK